MSLLVPPDGHAYTTPVPDPSTSDTADYARAWTDANPLWAPRTLTAEDKESLASGIAVDMLAPPELVRCGGSLQRSADRAGVWTLSTKKRQEEATVLSASPVYSPTADAPAQRFYPGLEQSVDGFNHAVGSAIGDEHARLAYFEVKIVKMKKKKEQKKSKNPFHHKEGKSSDDADNGLAIGFVAPPFPTWRLPGWERASVGVHSDDGHRFTYDNEGGKPFTRRFKAGQTVGLGMRFSATRNEAYSALRHVVVFMTRNGKETGSWDLYETVASGAVRDTSRGWEGLGGDRDLHAAVGVFGSVEAEILTGPENWLWKPTLQAVTSLSRSVTGAVGAGAVATGAGALGAAAVMSAGQENAEPMGRRERWKAKLGRFHSHSKPTGEKGGHSGGQKQQNEEKEEEEGEEEEEDSSSSSSGEEEEEEEERDEDEDAEGDEGDEEGGPIAEIVQGLMDALGSIGE